ncbi:hypothetical protein ACJDT4_21280 [Clostridium neuense]|uniref:Uncharacterized protein n=1 Tax=Clostridium neuense TaxID=1728934 RepID=A0ABW8TPM5_9CLOT
MYDDFINCYDKDMLIKNDLDEKSANGAFSIISKAIIEFIVTMIPLLGIAINTYKDISDEEKDKKMNICLEDLNNKIKNVEFSKISWDYIDSPEFNNKILNVLSKEYKNINKECIDECLLKAKLFIKDELCKLHRSFIRSELEGSKKCPCIVQIPIENLLFSRSPTVLKIEKGKENIVRKEHIELEKNNYINDKNGLISLKDEFENEFKYDGKLGTGSVYSLHVDKSIYNEIEEIRAIEEDGKFKLITKVKPNDQILYSNDIDFKNIKNIKSLKLLTNDNNIKVICSVDKGVTWKTYYNGQWKETKDEIEVFTHEGMTPNIFNSIKELWNKLINGSTIRFAYLIDSKTNIKKSVLKNIENTCDTKENLKKVNDNEYEISFSSDEIMEVSIYFSGDIKIIG